MAKKPKIQARKPPSLAAQQFVSGGAAEPKSRTGKTTIYTRKTGDKAGEDLRRVTVFLPIELHKLAKKAAVDAEQPFSDFVVKLLEKSLGVA